MLGYSPPTLLLWAVLLLRVRGKAALCFVFCELQQSLCAGIITNPTQPHFLSGNPKKQGPTNHRASGGVAQYLRLFRSSLFTKKSTGREDCSEQGKQTHLKTFAFLFHTVRIKCTQR